MIEENEKLKAILKKKNREIKRLKENIVKERQKFHEELRKNEFFEDILANVPGHVYWLDTNNIYLGCNTTHAINAGLRSRQEIIGKTNKDLPWKEQADELDALNIKAMKAGKSIIREESAILRGKYRTFLSQKVPMHNKFGEVIGILGISVDISEQKKLHQALREAKEAAEAANIAKTEFIANMSHDLRTPLSGVVGMSELMKKKSNDPEQLQYAEWIHACSQQLLELLTNILDMVALGNGQEDVIRLSTFDINQCLEELVHLEMPTVKLKGLDLIIDIDKHIPQYIISDRTKIHRIILNLLGNAIKFTESGHVAVSAKLLSINEQEALIYFAVSDTGIGIPKEHQERVFERFHRVSPSYKGTYEGHGVGLHIAQFYVRLLGGELQLNSELGVGTTFYFELPVKIGKKEELAALIPPSQLQNLEDNNPSEKLSIKKGYSVLVIEDNEIARHLIENFINRECIHYESVCNAEEAFSLIKTKPFDLVITDIGLPEKSGIELTKEIREWEKIHDKNPIPIVGLTAHSHENKMLHACYDCGMNQVFQKPVDSIKIHSILKYLNAEKNLQKSQFFNHKIDIPAAPGTGLPESSEALFQLEKFQLFDEQKGLNGTGNNLELLIDSVNSLINTIIPEITDEIQNAYQEKDWKKIEKLAHKLKGGALYLGVERLQYASQYMERYFKAGHNGYLEKLYQQLLDIAEDTQQHLQQWLSRQISNS